MIRNQFDDWLDHHTAHFPGVATWLGKFGEAQKSAILRVWYEHLAHCELEDCCKATTSLYGEGGKAPHYEQHPQAIRSIIRKAELAETEAELEPRYVNGEQVFACLLCDDCGRVICWHPKSIQAEVDEKLGEPGTVYTCVVACSCRAGDRYAKVFPRYSPERWLLAEERADLLEFAERVKAKQREAAF